MSHLDELESQSIYLLREAYHSFTKPAMLWSMGKDSNVLVWLAKKAFCGHIPFPTVHIDTTYEFPEMLEFRSWAQRHYGFDLVVWINEEARSRGIGYENNDPVTVTHELKTPVASIRLYLETLKKRNVDEAKRKEFYDIMLKDSDRLLESIEQILRAGRISPASRKPNLSTVTRTLLPEYLTALSTKLETAARTSSRSASTMTGALAR